MKKTALFAVCILLICVFCSCAAHGKADSLTYQTSAWVINADFSIGASRYSGIITLGAAAGGALSTRDMSITYTSPSSLSGLCAGIAAGSEFLKLGSLSIGANSGEFHNMLDVCRLFCIENATLDSSKQLELDGQKFKFVKISNDFGTYGLYLHNDTGLPRRIDAKISGTQITVDITKMETAEQNG